ncbi:MAG: DUF192 domain-containing protein [Anaerolineae bacterium]|nr:DUF192 domain-containing protein [Anaerolineae bacterium]
MVGLSFREPCALSEGAIFVCGSPGRFAAAIHTLGLRAPIGVVWLSADSKVVDKMLTKSWRFAHVPSTPAMYYLEGDPSILERVDIGDQLRIDEAVS